MSVETVHYFQIRARPTSACPDFVEVGGAYICCWIAHEDIAIAEQIAIESIEEAGWIVEETEERKFVGREGYEGDASLANFEQALTDGEAFVYHTWPTGCDDEK
ncbi:MAG: hypothetical protein ACR2H1_02825 [Limisphaerales bacterium]